MVIKILSRLKKILLSLLVKNIKYQKNKREKFSFLFVIKSNKILAAFFLKAFHFIRVGIIIRIFCCIYRRYFNICDSNIM